MNMQQTLAFLLACKAFWVVESAVEIVGDQATIKFIDESDMVATLTGNASSISASADLMTGSGTSVDALAAQVTELKTMLANQAAVISSLNLRVAELEATDVSLLSQQEMTNATLQAQLGVTAAVASQLETTNATLQARIGVTAAIAEGAAEAAANPPAPLIYGTPVWRAPSSSVTTLHCSSSTTNSYLTRYTHCRRQASYSGERAVYHADGTLAHTEQSSKTHQFGCGVTTRQAHNYPACGDCTLGLEIDTIGSGSPIGAWGPGWGGFAYEEDGSWVPWGSGGMVQLLWNREEGW